MVAAGRPLTDRRLAKKIRRVPRHRINPDEEYSEPGKEPASPIRPMVIAMADDELRLYKHHFGKTWHQMKNWLDAQGFITVYSQKSSG